MQPRFKDLPQFRDYFLRVLKNNYDSYQLLTAYVQQVYNCSGTDCGLDSNLMLREYSQAKTTEAAIRMTYAYAAVGARISESAEKERVCVHPSSECTQLIINEFLDLDFEFGANDPAGIGFLMILSLELELTLGLHEKT